MKKENSKKDNNNSPFKQFNFKFNFYWIYGIIFALLIGYQLLNSSDLASNKLTQNEFNEILNENDIEQILIVNGDIAQLTIKSEALNTKDKYKKSKTPTVFGQTTPVYIYDFGDLQNFEKNLDNARTELDLGFERTIRPEPAFLIHF